MEAKDDGGKTVKGRAEIDTRPPFRSVKDAVSLFGEGILCRDVDSPHKLKQTNPGGGSELESMTMKLEDTKQSLEKAREETELMATQMSSLKQELDNAKREIQKLKELRESKMVTVDSGEAEELKFVKDSPKPEDDHQEHHEEEEEDDQGETEFQKKRYVTFAHPTLSQIILPERNPSPALLERNPSIKKKNKNKAFTLLPLFGGIFPKRKNQM